MTAHVLFAARPFQIVSGAVALRCHGVRADLCLYAPSEDARRVSRALASALPEFRSIIDMGGEERQAPWQRFEQEALARIRRRFPSGIDVLWTSNHTLPVFRAIADAFIRAPVRLFDDGLFSYGGFARVTGRRPSVAALIRLFRRRYGFAFGWDFVRPRVMDCTRLLDSPLASPVPDKPTTSAPLRVFTDVVRDAREAIPLAERARLRSGAAVVILQAHGAHGAVDEAGELRVLTRLLTELRAKYERVYVKDHPFAPMSEQLIAALGPGVAEPWPLNEWEQAPVELFVEDLAPCTFVSATSSALLFAEALGAQSTFRFAGRLTDLATSENMRLSFEYAAERLEAAGVQEWT